jgi:hypothetical protein
LEYSSLEGYFGNVSAYAALEVGDCGNNYIAGIELVLEIYLIIRISSGNNERIK